MNKAERLELLELLQEKDRRASGRMKLSSYYPDKGPLRRELYPKHTGFFKGGKDFRERLMLAANRVGKTEGVGGVETTYHLTGQYPAWWQGRRFTRPVDWWAAGDTSKTVRDIIQFKLIGPIHEKGMGLIPRDCLLKTTPKQGSSGAIDTAFIKHVSGGVSQIGFKSYDQKRESFQGTEKDGIWLDEEPPLDIYTECVLRTMTNNGMVILTFTPLMGMSETVMQFLPGGQIQELTNGSKMVVMATWDDAPHLTQKMKDELWASIPPFQRDARSKGIPQLGAGAIYPVPETDVLVEDFPIPDFWPRGGSLDVGWKRTSAGLWALDRDNDVLYRTGEHYRGEAEPSAHVHAIKERTRWRFPFVMDPAARGRSQVDGQQLMQMYKDLGLDVTSAINAVEAGIQETWERLTTGRLKVFKSCQNWIYEFRLYRRDEKGRIVKVNDHAMDDTRYMCMSGIERMKVKPPETKAKSVRPSSGGNQGWMGG